MKDKQFMAAVKAVEAIRVEIEWNGPTVQVNNNTQVNIRNAPTVATVHGLPFPLESNLETLALLKAMATLQIEHEYKITYLHSYGQDSPWFAALSNRRLLASREAQSGYTYATPRGNDMYSGEPTEWIDITDRTAQVHAFTVCHFGSEEFLPETPFILALIEFEGVNTLLLTRLMGLDPHEASLDWIGMRVCPQCLRNSKLKPTDVYFVPASDE